LHFEICVAETVPLSWWELARRTGREVMDDDVFGLAAQLSYYFFLALFPAILFLLALASFFPLSNITDDVGRSLGAFVSPQVLDLIQEQMRRLANNENGGLLTFGVAGALWSSSAALVSIVSALNRAYDITEGRSWWKVRLLAIGLTLGVALIVLVALSLVLVGPALAERLERATGWGAPFEWTWLVLQWPLVFALIASGIGLIYYFGPDADQDWVWITPGAVAATILWLVVSLLFKVYVANFTDYEGSYGTVGGVIVVLLWFYLSGIAILAGAELNAEIEHASPYGKAPGQKNAKGKLLIGARAARAFRQRQASIESPPVKPPASTQSPVPTEHVGAVLTVPPSAQLEPRVDDAWHTHLFRGAAVGAVAVGVALAFAASRSPGRR
jgi:membrane protein